jgi:sugar/nucleoside kinase (ribokinase family)
VTYDVVCLGSPFLDLIFAGLPELPAAGTETGATGVHVSPGGIANVAIGLHRLGLKTALVGPRGADLAGRELARLLEAEGVEWLGPEVSHSGLTVAMLLDGDRAMISFDPTGEPPEPAEVARLKPRAIVGDHPTVTVPGARRYAGAGYQDAAAAERDPGRVIGAADTLIVNEVEAALLTGAATAEAACTALANSVETAVVTLGASGAIGSCGGIIERRTPPPGPVVDTLGAGDLFIAAYIWADLEGFSLGDRLAWAVLSASLSVRVPTTLDGAPHHARLVEEGRALGLRYGRDEMGNQSTREGEVHAGTGRE